MATLGNIIAETVVEFKNYCLTTDCAYCPFSYCNNGVGLSCSEYIIRNPLSMKKLFPELNLKTEINSSRRVKIGH